MISTYELLKVKKHCQYGDKFDESELAEKFKPYYATEKRIKVQFSYGEVKSGTIGVTSGWKPVFLLMLRKDSKGSSYTLSDKDMILTCKN